MKNGSRTEECPIPYLMDTSVQPESHQSAHFGHIGKAASFDLIVAVLQQGQEPVDKIVAIERCEVA